MKLPQIIQGGMGIGVSGWQLASAVSRCGGMGVVSGLCLDQLMIRRLQLGDPGGHIRRALEHFPVKDVVKRITDKFFKLKNIAESFIHIEMQTPEMSEEREDLIVAGGFTEIFLAKENHDGPIGVNLLEKTQTDTLATLYGCMLAGVDFVTMGAGIPRSIPGHLDTLSKNLTTELKLTVTNAKSDDDFKMTFNPARFKQTEDLKRPKFLAIVSSNALASTLSKKSTGKVDGFIIESTAAGGHNAPARQSKELSETGEPVYGAKDAVDLEKIKEIGLPFWLAGDRGSHDKLNDALKQGAAGIQIGTPFMLLRESGILPELRRAILKSDRKVFTDPKASPTGFPFKVIQVPHTLSEESVFRSRKRLCNLGYLRERYVKPDGTLGYRCSAEGIEAYVAKNGCREDALNSKCLCNALMANIGLGTVYRNGYTEEPLLTGGNALSEIDYIDSDTSVKDFMERLLNKPLEDEI